MKRLRIIGFSLLALFALGALLASSASAVEGVLPLNVKTFTLLGTNAALETHEKEQIKCATAGGSGTFENDHHGTATLDFNGCEIAGFPAFSLGEKEPKTVAEALILVPVLFLICLINSAALTFGIWVELKETVHIHAKAIGDLVEVKGTVIGEFLTKEGKIFVVDFAGFQGLGNVTLCLDINGNDLKTNLLSEEHLKSKKFVESSEKVEKGLMQFAEVEKLMDT
jgi:hypothetical protein